ncbi:T7SS effector LXG polymorphic toxin [Staphylococcus epidermidis]|uniref:T7SS effector LXG polymorphic toxin n=1 Tax=Staphylococcus epidermidis TaxID=1282 RepID=UPI00266D065C|nr:T7SS effector LXG polymorphic toxin [Staphylococcus epidermidis]MCG1681733.1 LXG domain-containing protein [Staphylococcus epidermidis]MDO2946205.1 T7SS effector LXG polymorphic toxin [Staphylococcus epidermidis]
MSIDMYVGKSKGQSSDVESTVKSISSGYDNLQKAIMQFVGASELQGQAYDSGKQFFSSVIAPLTESIKTLGELTEQACNDFVDKYQSEVDSQSLKESELIQDIEELEKQVSQLKAMNASLKHKSSKNSSLLSGNDQMISSLEQQKKELEEKLRKLRQFDAKSSNIFKDVESFQKKVQQGINQAKTAWDPGKQAFNIPAGKDMEWAKVSQQKALEVRMDKINQKAKDGKKLSKNDIFTIIAYQQQKKINILPKSVQKYMDENANDISKDLTVDGTTTLLEEYGKYLENNPGLTINGKMLKDYGVGIARAGKYGSNVMGGIGFGTGVYSDITQDHKTAGEAVAHNGLTTGVGAGAGLITGTAITILATNPGGWAVLGGIAAGTVATYAVEQAYKHNFLGLKTGTDWVGKNVLDPAFDRVKHIYSIEKGKLEIGNILISEGYNKVKNHGKKIMKDDIVPSVMNGMNAGMSKVNEIRGNTESTIKDYQVKTNQTIKNTKKTINQVSDTVKDTSHHVKEHVGQSINNVSKSLNPMKGW